MSRAHARIARSDHERAKRGPGEGRIVIGIRHETGTQPGGSGQVVARGQGTAYAVVCRGLPAATRPGGAVSRVE